MSASDFTHRRTPDDPLDILLVEDNPGDVRLMREALSGTDGETRVHDVANGNDAVDVLTQDDPDEPASNPDLLILDLNLPGRDGIEVLETIRDEPGLRTLPVIVLTSSDSDEDVVRCYRAHANAYLTKPTHHDELAELMETVERFWFSIVELPRR